MRNSQQEKKFGPFADPSITDKENNDIAKDTPLAIGENIKLSLYARKNSGNIPQT